MYTDEPSSRDAFMTVFKEYRQLKSLSSHSSTNTPLLNFNIIDQIQSSLDTFRIKKLDLSLPPNGYETALFNFGLKSPSEWNCYELISNPGFFIIPNPFKPGHQRFFVKQCLYNYHSHPNKTNLDHNSKRDKSVCLWRSSIPTQSRPYYNFSEFNKLRWATVGYHYNWTDKIYDPLDFTPLPPDLVTLCRIFASALFPDTPYQPEAGIINYYHLNSTLSAHQDHSEYNMKAPLISVSLGCPAIFLIGSESKSVIPDAICLNSGDICVMSGPARLSYHAVPKVFADSAMDACWQYSHLSETFKKTDFFVDEDEWAAFYEYIKCNRINMNIRQVF